MVFKHIPQYGQFYLQDPVHYDQAATAKFQRKDVDEVRAYAGKGIVAVFVVSEFSEIPVEVEVSQTFPSPDAFDSWDRVVDTSIEVVSEKLVLAGCPDGPEYGAFGSIPLKPGHYGVRIYYGDQVSTQQDGSSHDRYRIRIWPSKPISTRVVFVDPQHRSK